MLLKMNIFGRDILIDQQPVSGVETGWRIWNAAYVVLRYLEKCNSNYSGKIINVFRWKTILLDV